MKFLAAPAGSTSEVEDYEVCLGGVAVLELSIRPYLVRGNALATGRMARRLIATASSPYVDNGSWDCFRASSL
jgi:hypothetical protein